MEDGGAFRASTHHRRGPCVVHRVPRRNVVAKADEGGLGLLGQDVLYFLGATVAIIPIFKRFQISPVLGFLASGVILHQLG